MPTANQIDGVSCFFAPRSDTGNRVQRGTNTTNRNTKNIQNPLFNNHAEWETPIGLTPGAAIEIPDGDDDDDDDDDDDEGEEEDHVQNRPVVTHSGSCSSDISSNDKRHQIYIESSPHGHVNPFQEFAYQIGGCETSYFSSLNASNNVDGKERWVGKAPLATNINERNMVVVQSSDGSNNANNTTTLQRKRKQKVSSAKQSKRGRKTNKKNRADNGLPFLQMTPADQERCKVKWQSFTDENAPLEIRRFQVFIAARLHCQAHENTVRAAMLTLRKYFSSSASTTATTTRKIHSNTTVNNDDGHVGEESQPIGEQTDNEPRPSQNQCALQSPSSSMLCSENLSKADPGAISQMISSVLFANVKSKQIVKAANEINVRFQGIVPESQHGLQQLTGIGPKLGELLHYVNSKKAYDR